LFSQIDPTNDLLTSFDIGGKRKRPYDTVLPLAEDLGLKIDTHCDRDKPKCVAKAINEYKGDGNVLISYVPDHGIFRRASNTNGSTRSWEHKKLTDVIKALGVDDAEKYPSDRFDVIWTLSKNYKYIKDKKSEGCPGLDEKYAGEEQDFCEED
jgi:hypothetical protein